MAMRLRPREVLDEGPQKASGVSTLPRRDDLHRVPERVSKDRILRSMEHENRQLGMFEEGSRDTAEHELAQRSAS
jgi:hypothetical protein